MLSNLSHLVSCCWKALSINTYGGTEIPVFWRCVAGMIKRAVRIISIIKNELYADMKQEPQGYNITPDKLEFVRNTLKIMWRFLPENFDDFCRKILTIFLWKDDCVLQKNLMVFGRKFNAFCEKRVDNLCRKIWQFLYKNLTIFARKFDVLYKKMCQVLQENLKVFAGKF